MLRIIEKHKVWLIVTLFILILVGARLVWTVSFHSSDQPLAVNGQLDLREWDAAEDGTLTLDGEWEFYPNAFLIRDEGRNSAAQSSSTYIEVPGNWNEALRPDGGTPYGFGSYRLTILVHPDKHITYSVRIPSVRSSSELYVNGQLLAKSGQPSEHQSEYTAHNVPYSASFTAKGSSQIEIVVQAANFNDPRHSGIVRSIKFGTEEAVTRETQLSMALQQIVAVVFVIHAVYALILYFAGSRERTLLFFSLLTVSAMLMLLLGSEEKLLHYWIAIDYEMGFKLVYLSMVVISYSLIRCVINYLPAYWLKLFSGYTVLCGIAFLLPILLTSRQLVVLQPYYMLLMGVSICITIAALIRMSIKESKGNVLLLLSLVAFSSHFAWWGFFLATGIKVMYYPFDLIISTVCFASVWFRRYFQVHFEMTKLTGKLQRADKRKDEFLANTSHELRNPLHSILNLSQAVLERDQHALDEKSKKDLEIVLSVGRRMSIMLNDLLDAISMQESVPRLQLRRLSIQTIVTGVMDMVHFKTEGKPVRLVNYIPKHFPSVLADENRIIQVIFNLLHNAVKYTNAGEISIRAIEKDGRAYISILDTGIGMDEETMRRVFEPYEQADPGKTMIEGGFGLGLSISKQLVELHGGTLEASSVPGEGSEFVFTLQLADSTDQQEEADKEIIGSLDLAKSLEAAASAPSELAITQQSLRADRPRILVVDDDPINLKVLDTILSSEQYDITTVTSGLKALDILDAMEWDLVISDVMMPQMSGYELTRTIRSRFTLTELPVLLLTARSRPEDIENGFLSGANDYVTKPVDAMEVRSRVKALTEVKQSVRERLQMEAAWLQAQIQPHFLFNTLNAVAALSEIDLDRMRNLLNVFSHFLRDKFKYQNVNELAPIEEELTIVRSYLYIEKERFDDRLQVNWEIDDGMQLKIPLLTIQPLVENAVRHGIMQRTRGGIIHIRLKDYETYAEIEIADNGVGMSEEQVQHIFIREPGNTSGIGLLNTDRRLKRHYGRGLQIDSRPGYGTSISFIINKNV